MENLKSPVIINLLILCIYSIFFRLEVTLVEQAEYGNLGIAIYSMFAIGLQVIINLVLSANIFSSDPQKKQKGKRFLLCAFLVLLIGFPTCVTNAMMW